MKLMRGLFEYYNFNAETLVFKKKSNYSATELQRAQRKNITNKMKIFLNKCYYITFTIIFLFLMENYLQANDIRISNKSDHGLTITFKPQEYKIITENFHSKFYTKINFLNNTFNFSTGMPQIPGRTIMIGIPFGAKVNLELLERKEKKTLKGKIIPVPLIGGKKFGQIEYKEDAQIYQSNQNYPAKNAEISSAMIFRNQQVVELKLYPVQFDPQNEFIHLFEQLIVRVNFLGGENQQANTGYIEKRKIYDKVLINPSQSAKWRKIPKKISKRLKTNYEIDFYKIYVNENGIYKVTGSDLKDAGLNLNNINSSALKIFNNGGLSLPLNIETPRSDSLIENAIIVEDGGDGIFDKDDYILFYGKSVKDWRFDKSNRQYRHYLHPYTRNNVYWFSWQNLGSGKRIQNRQISNSLSAVDVTNFQDHFFVENEYKNLLNSGTCWLGNYFSSAARQRIYSKNLKGALPNKPAEIRLELAGISNHQHRFVCYLNDSFIGNVPWFYGVSGQTIIIKKKYFTTEINSGLIDGYNNIKIEYQPNNDVSLAYMDWIEFDFYRQLKADNDLLEFYSPDSAGMYKYTIQSFSTDDVLLFDISQFNEVAQIQKTVINSGTIEFVDTTSSNIPKKYFAVSPEKFKQPINIEKDIKSNWRNYQDGANFLIITYDVFYDAVLPLKSLRENCDNLKTAVVKISDVFDEFSWGLTDPTAIRDFIKYTFDNWQPAPEYVLLFGDGDFDYKNFISPQDPNWLPPMETSELDEDSNRARDDWFVCVSGNDDLMDLAIGRIPVRNFDQALNVVKKIIDYKNDPHAGEWCNTITMVADDEFGQGGGYDSINHIPDAENTCENYIPKRFNVRKIYLTEYPAQQSASISGIRKPAATQALLEQINKGCLIVNFIGHGNEQLLAHERVINIADDFSQIENGHRLAFWIAATCDFGRWDNPDFQSFAEQLLTVDGRGAIATFAACRASYPNPNVALNQKILQNLLSVDSSIRLGDAIMAAKVSRGEVVNDQRYHLFGDPTLQLNMPLNNIKINRYSPDSIRALSKMDIAGTIENPFDSTAVYGGKILLSAYDSRKQRIHQVNINKSYQYKLPGNSIFRGVVSVKNNEFLSQFIVPKDITYGGKEGRLDAFYWDETNIGSGFVEAIPVGGTQTNFVDKEGPFIKIGFNGQDFSPGGFVPANCELEVTIEDKTSGVNIAGDIGHKIILTLDNEEDNKNDLTDYFQYEKDSYTTGNIYYPLTNISEGRHQLRIKAWDNCNNSSAIDVEFTVVSGDQLIMRDLLNYPNPFSTTTEITFWINQDCDVCIKIYTLSGRLIRTIDDLNAEYGFNHFYWDGLDQDQNILANGVYLYKVSANRLNGTQRKFVHEIQKCVIVR